MDFIFQGLKIIGALGFFIYGMKVMSDSIQKAAANKLRQVLGAMTHNRYLGVLTGFLITAILQSSSATTVMTVSFVNAGLLSLIESGGIMMGANIGTTITGWLISLIGFKVKIAAIALPIIAFGMPMMFSKRDKIKNWGGFLVGFALLFMGLSELKQAVPDLKTNPEILSWLKNFSDSGFFTRCFFVLIGALLTIVVQSSSAAMSLTIILVSQGLPIDIGAAMVLGENIGTTITAEIASSVGNAHARRSAKIHSTFNIIGVSWMVIILPYFLDLLEYIVPAPANGDTNKFALATFHTAFNLINVSILIWFMPQLARLAVKLVPMKEDEKDDEFSLDYIGMAHIETPELSIIEAKKEINKFGKIAKKITENITKLIEESDENKFIKLRKKIIRQEDVTDKMEEGIVDYLVNISKYELSKEATAEVRMMLSIAHDLENVGDICEEMASNLNKRRKQNVYFTPELKENIDEMLEKVNKGISIMRENINANNDTNIDLSIAVELDEEVQKLYKKLTKDYIEGIKEERYKVANAMYYKEVLDGLVRISHHTCKVTEAIAEKK